MFYKLFGLFAESAGVNRDVILLCPVTGSQLFHELSDTVNQGGKFTVEEERVLGSGLKTPCYKKGPSSNKILKYTTLNTQGWKRFRIF